MANLIQGTVADLGQMSLIDFGQTPFCRKLLRKHRLIFSSGCRPGTYGKLGAWHFASCLYRPTIDWQKTSPRRVVDALQRVRHRALKIVLRKIEAYLSERVPVGQRRWCKGWRFWILQGQWLRERILPRDRTNDVWLELSVVIYAGT